MQDMVGQRDVTRGCKSRSTPPASGASRWGISCSTARPAWARRRSPPAFRAPGRQPANRQRGRAASPQGFDSLSDQCRGRLGPVHRRDPSAGQGGRGILVSGDGRFSHRHRAGRRGQRPHDQHGAAAVHADRGHHAGRAAVGSAARSLSDARAPRFLHASTSWPRSSAATPPSCRWRSTDDAAAGDRHPQPRHAATGQQPPALGPRLRHQQGRRPRDAGAGPAALEMQGIDPLGSTARTANTWRRSSACSTAGRSGSKRSPTP